MSIASRPWHIIHCTLISVSLLLYVPRSGSNFPAGSFSNYDWSLIRKIQPIFFLVNSLHFSTTKTARINCGKFFRCLKRTFYADWTLYELYSVNSLRDVVGIIPGVHPERFPCCFIISCLWKFNLTLTSFDPWLENLIFSLYNQMSSAIYINDVWWYPCLILMGIFFYLPDNIYTCALWKIKSFLSEKNRNF